MTGTLYRQAFVPWANIIGGYIFGMGIVLAGGCGSGILYRVGEGNLAYVFAVFGFFFGIAMTKFGFLKPIYDWMISTATYCFGRVRIRSRPSTICSASTSGSSLWSFPR